MGACTIPTNCPTPWWCSEHSSTPTALPSPDPMSTLMKAADIGYFFATLQVANTP